MKAVTPEERAIGAARFPWGLTPTRTYLLVSTCLEEINIDMRVSDQLHEAGMTGCA
jgi:hypothetical protein